MTPDNIKYGHTPTGRRRELGHRHDGGHAVPAVGDRGAGYADAFLRGRGHAIRVLPDGREPEEKPRVVSALAEDQQHHLLLQNGMER